VSARPRAHDRLANPDAFLSRSDLRELGLERRAVDAVFRSCPVVVFEGYSRPLLRVEDFLAYRDRCTFRGDRVRPT
jgi:hypothetical protein